MTMILNNYKTFLLKITIIKCLNYSVVLNFKLLLNLIFNIKIILQYIKKNR